MEPPPHPPTHTHTHTSTMVSKIWSGIHGADSTRGLEPRHYYRMVDSLCRLGNLSYLDFPAGTANLKQKTPAISPGSGNRDWKRQLVLPTETQGALQTCVAGPLYLQLVIPTRTKRVFFISYFPLYSLQLILYFHIWIYVLLPPFQNTSHSRIQNLSKKKSSCPIWKVHVHVRMN